MYLALVLGAGPSLRNVHIESSGHGHRYCPEHRQIEAVGHAGGPAAHGHDGLRPPGIHAAPEGIPDPHVACAVLNFLATRAPVAPEADAVGMPAAGGAACAAFAFVERNDPFESVLSNAPKTSPPAAA